MPIGSIRSRPLALVAVAGPAEATHDCPSVTRSHEHEDTDSKGDTYRTGSGVQKADSSCNDLNLVGVKNVD